MTFEKQYVFGMALVAIGYLAGWYGRWDERWKQRRRERLIERLGRERGGW